MNQASKEETELRGASEIALFERMEATSRPGMVAREFWRAAWSHLKERHFAGASGGEIVRELTEHADRLVAALFRHADAEHGRRMPRLHGQLTVIARGGYGRGELNPCSDIDLLFLNSWKPGPYCEIVAEIILHALWDAGLTVGHAVRNIRESQAMANVDFKEKTALLDTRFVAGDEALYAEFRSMLASQVINRGQQKFFRAKLEESRARHARYGDSVYLLEPQIKEGEGGLRDLHTAMWVAKVKYKAATLDELAQRAIVSPQELSQVLGAREFLWRVRNSLHYLSGRHFDQLTFEYQDRIAPLLGIQADDGLSPSQALMRRYYMHANTIHMFAESFIARVIDETRPAAVYYGRSFSRQIRPGVFIQRELLTVAAADFFRRDPLNLVTIFADCQRHRVDLAGSTYQLVRDCLGMIDDSARNDPRIGRAFYEILQGKTGVARTLELMHRSGVLGALIPEFGRLYARPLQDLYHIYTVDRHSLAAVRELEDLRAGRYREQNSLLTEVARDLQCTAVVYLALLLHDIGKGHGSHHHERSAELAAAIARRIGLDSEKSELVVFLVRNHLLMSQIIHKRDLQDERTVSEFTRAVGSIERLKALYVLTYADMKAVAPNVYNNWRDSLLSELYMRTLHELEHGDHEAVDPERSMASAKQAARELLEGSEPGAVESFLERMPERYFLGVGEHDIPLHFELLSSLGNDVLKCRHRHFSPLQFTEFSVVTRDQPGLFSKIAGVLTANNLNILSARIMTTRDGLALDVFRVSHLQGGAPLALDEERWNRVENQLLDVLAGRRDVEALVSEARKLPLWQQKKHAPRFPTEVTIDNRASETLTVIDVFTQDRIGLLYTITHLLYKLGIRIHLARISTYADRALDVFYVSDQAGNKLTDPVQMDEIRLQLLALLGEQPHAAVHDERASS
jgi:[protein-PII] uridylyltransferase